ncbi:MAG: hypothetical protein AB8G15_08200 [Saprospiraceae bacterium]
MTKKYIIMGCQIKVLELSMLFWMLMCCNTIIVGQNLTISLEENGDVLLNDSMLNAVFFDVDRVSAILK